MAKAKRVEIELPFSGFYETWHDNACSEAVESYFMDDMGELSEVDADAIWSASVDWKAIEREYSAEYVSAFGHEYGLSLEFADMESPREYNFTTDRVFATVPLKEINKVRAEVEKSPNWAAFIKHELAPRDGFIPFIDNDIKSEEWTRKEWPAVQYRLLLEFWLTLKQTRGEVLTEEHELVNHDNLYNFDSVQQAIDTINKYKTEHAK